MASESSVDDLLQLAAEVYEGLSEKQIEEIERITLDRRDFLVDFGVKMVRFWPVIARR